MSFMFYDMCHRIKPDIEVKRKAMLCVLLMTFRSVKHWWTTSSKILRPPPVKTPSELSGIIWTNAGILLIGPLGINVSQIAIKSPYIFIWENTLENVVWLKTVNMSRPQCVDSNQKYHDNVLETKSQQIKSSSNATPYVFPLLCQYFCYISLKLPDAAAYVRVCICVHVCM